LIIPGNHEGDSAMAETRIVLQLCEAIDPGDITTYLQKDGFQALNKARAMGPEAIIAEIKASGLRGRGGAGFPCGTKWELARSAPGYEKYLVCNADEGEVGTFKDRYIIRHDPFSLLEGIGIAARAVGAQKAYVYLRAEYHYLLDGLKGAIDQTTSKGLLDLPIEIREGAGSYVCGEESALTNSIEGKRGEARYRPPFPPERGLFGKPTVINNVETLMNIPRIIAGGAAWFSRIGTAKSSGTKVFSVSGDVERPGVYELAMGSRLAELLDLAGAKNVKLVQIGGATGGIVPASMVNTPLSYETVLGSGAITVMHAARDVIDFVYRSMEFLNEESCGKCTPCREGTEVMVGILERLTKGEGAEEDIQILEELSRVMMDSSLCGLGQAAPIPLLDTLKYFRNDYENRIKQSVFLRTLR
jgi:NADH:ubiquinone oxidoreductase subunit F (NADH-binding)